jgi:hypothetical protein
MDAPRGACGCGAVVAHHLAKVRVASSNLVIRSVGPAGPGGPHGLPSLVGWPRGEATACKAVYAGSNPVPTSNGSDASARAIGAVVARFPDTEEVTGSNPVSPTTGTPGSAGGFLLPSGDTPVILTGRRGEATVRPTSAFRHRRDRRSPGLGSLLHARDLESAPEGQCRAFDEPPHQCTDGRPCHDIDDGFDECR